MTTEELLRPRYKVIADYPGSDFRIGDVLIKKIIQPDGYFEYIELKHGFSLLDKQPENYPAIFKKLEWWEEVRLVDLPKYVKSNPVNNYSKEVLKVKNFDFRVSLIYFNHSTNGEAKYFIPATLEEYTTYINSLK